MEKRNFNITFSTFASMKQKVPPFDKEWDKCMYLYRILRRSSILRHIFKAGL